MRSAFIGVAAVVLAFVGRGDVGIAQTFQPTQKQPAQSTPQQPSGENTYGSVALSKRGTQYGIASGDSSLREAERRALLACGKRAKDCEIFKSIENDCIALVIAKNAAAGWAAGGPSESDRRSRAMSECKTRRGDVCNFIIHFCSRDSN